MESILKEEVFLVRNPSYRFRPLMVHICRCLSTRILTKTSRTLNQLLTALKHRVAELNKAPCIGNSDSELMRRFRITMSQQLYQPLLMGAQSLQTNNITKTTSTPRSNQTVKIKTTSVSVPITLPDRTTLTPKTKTLMGKKEVRMQIAAFKIQWTKWYPCQMEGIIWHDMLNAL